MKYRFIVFFITSLIFFNCKKEVKKSTQSNTIIEEVNPLDTLPLRLNNGEKWIVNNATQIGVAKMDSILKSFNSNKDENYLGLGNNLSQQTSFIIKSCDMTGEAHDQLHVVLVPMLDEIYILKDSNDFEEQKRAVNNLELLIDRYYEHFKN